MSPDTRQRLLDDLRRQLPTVSSRMRGQTIRAIKSIERELAGTRGHALEKVAK